MDIEDLSKSQLLLLMVLVAFVISIATSVVTVSLLDEAPTTVTQTVNRIIDHTIQTVTTQVPIGNTPSASPSTEDQLTNAIKSVQVRTVSLYQGNTNDPIALGLYIPDSHMVVMLSDFAPTSARVTFSDGSSLSAERTANVGVLNRFTLVASQTYPSVSSKKFAAGASLKQGQTVIAIAGDGSASTGIITKITADAIYTSLSGIPAGSPAVLLSGEIVGIANGNVGAFIPADKIQSLVASP